MADNDHFLFTDILLIDIVGFSKLGNRKQYELISTFNTLYKKTIKLISGGKPMVLDFIPTGDGFYILLEPEYKGDGLPFSLSLKNMARKFKRDIPFFEGIRIAVHSGYLIKLDDIRGNPNYLGDGLNQCARYLNIRVPAEHEYYDEGGFTIVSESHYSTFNKKYKEDRNFIKTLQVLGFKRSQKMEIKDKHGFTHSGFLVRTMKDDVILLNKEMSMEKKKEASQKVGEFDTQIQRAKEKIEEYKMKLESFQLELDEAKTAFKAAEKRAVDLPEKIKRLEDLELKYPNKARRLKQYQRNLRLESQESQQKIDEKKEVYEKILEKEKETVPLLHSMIKRESEIIIQRRKKLQQDQKQLERGG